MKNRKNNVMEFVYSSRSCAHAGRSEAETPLPFKVCSERLGFGQDGLRHDKGTQWVLVVNLE